MTKPAVWLAFLAGAVALGSPLPAGAGQFATAPAVLTPAAPARGADRGLLLALEAHASLFSDAPDRPFLGSTFGYALRAGWRSHRWAIHVHVEHNLWVASEQHSEVVEGSLNVGVGAEFVYAGGLLRSALTIGPSILLFDTLIDDRGTVGVFVDVRPIGLRWTVGNGVTVGLDPLGFSLVAPVLGGIPLILTQYRTSLYVEFRP